MAIVRTTYRYKSPPKRKTPPAIPAPIVLAKPPKKRWSGPVRRFGGVQEPTSDAPSITVVIFA